MRKDTIVLAAVVLLGAAVFIIPAFLNRGPEPDGPVFSTAPRGSAAPAVPAVFEDFTILATPVTWLAEEGEDTLFGLAQLPDAHTAALIAAAPDAFDGLRQEAFEGRPPAAGEQPFVLLDGAFPDYSLVVRVDQERFDDVRADLRSKFPEAELLHSGDSLDP